MATARRDRARCRLGALQREGLPRHRRRRRVQSPRAGCRAARPHHRRARRGATSRGRGLRQRRCRQEHVDAPSRGSSARPGASDCDPGRGLQRPLAGAHGGCSGGAVRSRQRQGRAPACDEWDRGLLDGFADPGVGSRSNSRARRTATPIPGAPRKSSRCLARSSGPSTGESSTC